MNPNIINPNKYKKITRSDKLKKDKKYLKNFKAGRYKNSNKSSFDFSKVKKVKKEKKVKVKNAKNYNALFTFFKVISSVAAIVLIGYLSTYFARLENSPILNVFKNNKNDIKLEANYNLKIGINNLDIENNILINELYKYSYKTLIAYDKNYNIIYNAAKSIKKIDNNTYEIEMKDKNDIANVIYTVQKLKNDTTSRYYKSLSNISSIEANDTNIFRIKLTSPDPYIVYSLDFKIELSSTSTQKDDTNKFIFSNVSNAISFTRNDSVSRDILKNITFNDYADSDNMVSDFRNNVLDMFLTSSEEDMRLIGKHEYSVKKYRNGETYFLLGNKNSKLFSLSEVRKAIAYSLNRTEIAKQLSSTFAEIIDIPYIYSNVEYKYDIYGAENALIAQSWNKAGGIYTKNIGGTNVNLELKLLVNSDDVTKVNMAESIKQMLENVGIRIDIEKLKDAEITNKIKTGDYDLVLTSVYINNDPDITYLNDYIDIDSNITDAMNKIANSSVDDLSSNIQNLQNVISNEIACIGIVAKNTNVVYQKYINGFDNVSYMNVFNNIDSVGKIVQ